MTGRFRLPSLSLDDWPTLRKRLRTFIVIGFINTGATYVLFLLANLVTPYQAAFTISFAAGVVFSAYANGIWVFQRHPRKRDVVAYAVFYILNYVVRLYLLVLLVERFTMPEYAAPLVVVVVMIPVSYLGANLILGDLVRERKR